MTLDELAKQEKEIWKAAIEAETAQTGACEEWIRENMRQRIEVMKQSLKNGLASRELSKSGLTGMNAGIIQSSGKQGLVGETGRRAMLYAIAISEENARMGKIVAAPTAGSCGILPAVIISVCEDFGKSEDEEINAFLSSALIGEIIARKATISGAECGCQAECGAASAMAAAAACQLMGEKPNVCIEAAALAIKFVMGLVCDPVAGLVEVPCVKRNASGAMNALTAATLAMSGVKSVIPADEVIDSMAQVGALMTPSLKETSLAGLANTKTAKMIEKREMY